MFPNDFSKKITKLAICWKLFTTSKTLEKLWKSSKNFESIVKIKIFLFKLITDKVDAQLTFCLWQILHLFPIIRNCSMFNFPETGGGGEGVGGSRWRREDPKAILCNSLWRFWCHYLTKKKFKNLKFWNKFWCRLKKGL